MTGSMRSGLALAASLVLGGAPGSAQTLPAGAETARAVVPATEDLPYDPAGRRDPFRPPRASAPVAGGAPRTPLQGYEIGQLRLVAIVYDPVEPRAVVEDDEGLGYIVKVGTPIGPNGGRIDAIEQGRVVIEEDSVDFYGEKHVNIVVLDLRTDERGTQ
jgi:type IV pilus assembly protein PilP